MYAIGIGCTMMAAVRSRLRVLPPADPASAVSRVARGAYLPLGLRRIGADWYVDGSRLVSDDAVEVLLADGTWQPGRFWGAVPHPQVVASERGIAYVVMPGSIMRRAAHARRLPLAGPGDW